MGRAWLVGLVMVAVGCAAEKQHLLSPSEILKRMEASSTVYEVKELSTLDVARGTLAEVLWPQRVNPVTLPRVTRAKDGTGTVSPWPEPQSAEAQAAMKEAEAAFGKKDYAAAAEGYRRALVLAPDDYIVRAYLGDALLFGGDMDGAIAEYDRAIALNPDDYRLYFFRSNAHRHKQQLTAMVADLRTSLTLKPRNLTISDLFNGQRYPLHVAPAVLVPQAFVRREGNKVVIYADAERPEWLAWAMCKALWLGEPAHRKESLGDEKLRWSSLEESECLASLATVYESRRANREGERDDRLERLLSIVHDGLLTGLAVYELGARVDPQLVLRLDAEGRSLVQRYVEKYVLLVEPPKP